MLSMNFNVPLQMERKWYWLSGNSPNVNWTQHVCIGREGKLWQILLTRIWQCRADTVWFGFYYYRRSVVRAVFHRRWQIVGKVLDLNNVFCHCSASNPGLSGRGALPRVHTIISYLLWLKSKQPKQFYITSNMINVPEFQNMGKFQVWITVSLPVKMTAYFLSKDVAVIASTFRLWMTQDFVQKIYFKVESLEVL